MTVMAMPTPTWSCHGLARPDRGDVRGFEHVVSVLLPAAPIGRSELVRAATGSPSRIQTRRVGHGQKALSVSRVIGTRELPWDESCEMTGELAEAWAALTINVAARSR